MASGSPYMPEQQRALLNGPAATPPPGVQPNFEHPKNLWTTGTVVEILMLSLATIHIMMRLYTRRFIVGQIALEDYAIFCGWGIFCGYFAVGWRATQIAPGIHQWDLQLKYLGDFLYQIHVGAVIYGICILCIKTSILLQYLHIFVPTKKPDTMYWTCHGLIWLNTIFYIIASFTEIFACSPMAKAWDPLISGGHCITVFDLNVVESSINALTNIVILVLPQISIWNLQMSKKRKLQVSLIFLVGILACVSSIVHLFYTCKLLTATDVTYNSWLTGLWTYPELGSGIMIASLPVSGKFYQNLKEKTRSLLGKKSQLDHFRGQGSLHPSSGTRSRTWLAANYATLSDENHVISNATAVRSDRAGGDRRYNKHQDMQNNPRGIFVMRDIEITEEV
ncbi:hypothetical protein EV356DRAFT_536477 [Viridothelium virens]|uniref:Rhodopsin domain-containing protein n=1 Tax=Viridothelium virens TaxID=1048519 RepID=A0A6A6GY97_VIRVR|nr:hypothetical protein EV356DRAFT_536477 [Viridothelium virens]